MAPRRHGVPGANPVPPIVTHASASREEADTWWCVATPTEERTDGARRFAARVVTGETTEHHRALRVHPGAAWPDRSRPGRRGRFLDGVGLANVARCGLEIALLDALAREHREPQHRYLADVWPDEARSTRKVLRCSGPLGLAPLRRTAVNALKLRLYGFPSVKLKLGDDLDADRRRLRVASACLGRGVELRVDANQAWDIEYAEAITPVLRRCRVVAVEQPFPRTRPNARAFSRNSGIPVVLDESLCSEEDARQAVSSGGAFLFALKLAKLGGFRSSLRVIALAAAHQVPVQVSCQVGESAILSAAGRHLAALCPNLRYLEGSYDRFLLAANVTRAHVGFGRGGRAPLLRGPASASRSIPPWWSGWRSSGCRSTSRAADPCRLWRAV